MDNLNKELLFNVSLVSFLLTGLFAGLGAQVQGQADTIMLDRFIVFMFLFFVLYAFHAIVSLVHYVIGRIVRPLPLRLLIFNLAGAAMLAAAWLVLKEAEVLAVYGSFLVFTAVTVFLNQRRIRSHPV